MQESIVVLLGITCSVIVLGTGGEMPSTWRVSHDWQKGNPLSKKEQGVAEL